MTESQLDDEEYVYMTEEGQVTPKLELSALWTGYSLRTMVTIAKTYLVYRESLAYLPIRITECMEKFSLFSGLTGLTACDLKQGNGELLPCTGIAGQYLKSGDSVCFEIESRDLWLSVELKCPEEKVEIAFEAKVSFDLSILKLRANIFEYAISVLKARNQFPLYILSDFALFRTLAPRPLSLPCDSLRPLPLVRHDQRSALTDSQTVRDYFTYVSCFMTATLQSPSQPLAVCSLEPEDYPNETLKSAFPIRKLKVVEPDESRIEPEMAKKRPKPPATTSCRGCFLS